MAEPLKLSLLLVLALLTALAKSQSEQSMFMDGSKDFEDIRNKLQNRCNLFYTRPKFERCSVTRNQKQMMNELIAKFSTAAKDLATLSRSFDMTFPPSRGTIIVEDALSAALSSVTEAKNQLKMMFGNGRGSGDEGRWNLFYHVDVHVQLARYIDGVVRSSLDSMLANLMDVQSDFPCSKCLKSLLESVTIASSKLSTILENPKGMSDETVRALTESSADLQNLVNFLQNPGLVRG